jgi:hypothetical protein
MEIPLYKVEEIARGLSVNTNVVTPEMLRTGMLIELEHGTIDPRTNVTNDNLIMTAKIALAHLTEDLYYYSRLKYAEDEGDKYWSTRIKPNVFTRSAAIEYDFEPEFNERIEEDFASLIIEEIEEYGKIQLVLEFEKVEIAELIQSESNPTVRVFPSKHITKSRTVTELCISHMDTLSPPQIMVLKWNDCFNSIDGSVAAILFELICQTTVTEYGNEGYNYKRMEPLASALIPLIDLISSGSKKETIIIELIDRSQDEPIVRAVLHTKVLKFSITAPTKVISNQFNWDAIKAHHETCEDIVDRFFEFYRRDDVKPIVSRAYSMHIPRYRMISGCLPGASYRCTTMDKSMTEVFARHILELTIRMNGWTPEEVIELLEKQMESGNTKYYLEVNAVLRMIGEAITTTANCMDYMSDHSGKIDVEWFKFSRAGLYAGDCEDVGEESALVAVSIMNLYKSNESQDGKDKLVQAIAKLLHYYVILMVTAMATTPSAGSPKTRSKEDEYICHIYACAVPRFHVLRMIEEGLKFVKHETDLNSLREAMNQDIQMTVFERGLHLLVLEGTNFCIPLQLPLPLYAPKEHRKKLIDEVMRMEQFRASLEEEFTGFRDLSVQIQQKNLFAVNVMSIPQEKYSGFYRWLIDAWIDLRPYGIYDAIDFSMGYNRTSTGEHIYGIDFRDWVMMNPQNSAGDKVALVPTYFLSKSDWESIEYLRQYEYPIAEWTEVPKPMSIPELEVMRSEYNIQRRSPFIPPYVIYRVNRREKLSSKLLSDMKRTTSGSGTIKAKMDYFGHPLSKDGELYFIEIRMYPQ